MLKEKNHKEKKKSSNITNEKKFKFCYPPICKLNYFLLFIFQQAQQTSLPLNFRPNLRHFKALSLPFSDK